MSTTAKELRPARQSEWERRAQRRQWLIIGARVSARLALIALIANFIRLFRDDAPGVGAP